MAKKYLQLAGVLKRLLFERDMKPIDLAREVNMPPPTIHRLVTGKSTRPYKSSLKPIADFFSVTVDQLTGEQSTANSLVTMQENAFQSKMFLNVLLIPWDKLLNPHLLDKNKY